MKKESFFFFLNEKDALKTAYFLNPKRSKSPLLDEYLKKSHDTDIEVCGRESMLLDTAVAGAGTQLSPWVRRGAEWGASHVCNSHCNCPLQTDRLKGEYAHLGEDRTFSK